MKYLYIILLSFIALPQFVNAQCSVQFFNGSSSVCQSDKAVSFPTATPTGGFWSGSAVNSGGKTFDARKHTGSGNEYIYTVSVNGCTSQGTYRFSVIDSTTVVLNQNKPFELCEDIGLINVNDYIRSNNIASYASSNFWTHEFITNGNFNTDEATPKIYKLVLNSNTVCPGKAVMDLKLKAKPVIKINELTPICADFNDALPGATPTGGRWAANGVLVNELDVPELIKDGVVTVGNGNSLKYTYYENETDFGGCVQ